MGSLVTSKENQLSATSLKVKHLTEQINRLQKQVEDKENEKVNILKSEEIYTLLLNTNSPPTSVNSRGHKFYKGIWVQGKEMKEVLEIFGNPDSTRSNDSIWIYDKKCVHSLTKKNEDLYIYFLKIDADRNHTGKMQNKVICFKIGRDGEKVGYNAIVGDTFYPKNTHLEMFLRQFGIY